jgi:hypothetical protein
MAGEIVVTDLDHKEDDAEFLRPALFSKAKQPPLVVLVMLSLAKIKTLPHKVCLLEFC